MLEALLNFPLEAEAGRGRGRLHELDLQHLTAPLCPDGSQRAGVQRYGLDQGWWEEGLTLLRLVTPSLPEPWAFLCSDEETKLRERALIQPHPQDFKSQSSAVYLSSPRWI